MNGFRACHKRDGAALVKYLAWLENELVINENTNLNEFDAALKLSEFRKQQQYFMGESFETISSTGNYIRLYRIERCYYSLLSHKRK